MTEEMLGSRDSVVTETENNTAERTRASGKQQTTTNTFFYDYLNKTF